MNKGIYFLLGFVVAVVFMFLISFFVNISENCVHNSECKINQYESEEEYE